MDGTLLPAVTGRSGLAAQRPLGAQVASALQAAARSDHTRRAYLQAVGLFLEYLGQVLEVQPLASSVREGRTEWGFAGQAGILRQVLPGHLDGFCAWRTAAGDSPSTVNLRLAAVTTFLRVAYRDGVISDTAAQRLGLKPYTPRQKRDRKPVGRRLNPQEVQDLRAAVTVNSTLKGKRDLLILDLMLFAGLRCQEVANLNLDNLTQDGGHWWLVFAGKGQKTRKVRVHDTLYTSLAAWLVATGRGLPGEGPLLWPVNKWDVPRPGRLPTSTINRLVAEYGAKAGLAPLHGANRLSPHDLRRTCARNAYDNGAPLPYIQRLLGHADVTTTMQYIGDDSDGGGGAVDFVRYDPRSSH